MDNENLVRNWHRAIIDSCKVRLARDLTKEEEKFIVSRGSFIALEIIEDTVNSIEGDELEKYLNSESE